MKLWLTGSEACERLGIRPQTLYAYVSRGLLTSRKEGRRSFFAVAEIEALAQRTARGRRPGRLEIHIDTDLTLIDPDGRLYYRGVDATEIAGRWSFERTAHWLWHGIDRPTPVWTVHPQTVQLCRAAQRTLPAAAAPLRRVLLSAAVAAGGEQLSPETAIATIVASLPATQRTPAAADDGIAAALIRALTAAPATAELRRAVDVALVLLADHELATSTLAVRLATSTGAGTGHALVAGLAALAGPRHGTASQSVEELYRQAESTGFEAHLGDLERRDIPIPGVSHIIYTRADPRAATLLEAAIAAMPPGRRRVVRGTVEAVRRRAAGAINVDMALGALVYGTGMTPGSGAAIYGIGRMAGWLAHAAEEAHHTLRFRPRAVYTGVRPG